MAEAVGVKALAWGGDVSSGADIISSGRSRFARAITGIVSSTIRIRIFFIFLNIPKMFINNNNFENGVIWD